MWCITGVAVAVTTSVVIPKDVFGPMYSLTILSKARIPEEMGSVREIS